MTHRYAQVAFTEAVRRHQETHRSRSSYARMEQGPPEPDRLGPDELDFVAGRDSFYLASTGETGWPYVQHRGGPRGFLQALDPGTLAFADYRGNRQYITTGNLDHDDRVSLLLMDYPMQARLKIYGRARAVDASEAGDLVARLHPREVRVPTERVIVIAVEAFDWNCRQHILPRYSVEEVNEAVAPLRLRLEQLEQENAALRARLEADPLLSPAPPLHPLPQER
ncbi:pyridoxamine 5'-phosphate oxidase family protein [Streptomyces thermolineatus]|uniref:Pyridoxamine 5'-phosphate oxidase family protein n=1 Tax=Streptomyces thermolineatus TaxID=44033 RepID=A0ABN3KR34_9ACTN